MRIAFATPRWVDRAELAAIHDVADTLRAFGVDAVVDHIIPLAGTYVCGLNVPWNLQIIDTLANKRKGFRHHAYAPGLLQSHKHGGIVLPMTRAKKPNATAPHYSGEPCGRCHGTLRYKSTHNCVACLKGDIKARRQRVAELANTASPADLSTDDLIGDIS